MALDTINGLRVLSLRISEPRSGVWHADVEADAAEDVAGAVEILVEGKVRFAGTVYRGGLEQGRWRGRVVGGAGTLRTNLPARFYSPTTLGDVLADVAKGVGHEVGELDEAVSSFAWAQWHRASGRAADAVGDLFASLNRSASAPGAVWRVSREGTLVGLVDAFEDQAISHHVESTDPSSGEVVIAPSGDVADLVRPGASFNGLEVDYVTTSSTARGIRQILLPRTPA